MTQRIKNKELRIMLFINLFLVFIYLVFIINDLPFKIHNAHAQESTDSAKPASSSAGLTDSIKDKLEEFKKEVASKAATLKEEIDQKTQNKAFIGTVLEVSGQKVTLETKKGVKKTILVNEYTTFENISKTKRTMKSVNDVLGSDAIAALGDVDDNGVLTAKKLVKVEPIASSSAKFIWGKISTVVNPTIEVKNKDNIQVSINTTANTNFYLGSEEASILDAKPNRFLIAKGIEKQEGQQLNASFIYLIPSYGVTKPEKKEATSSPTPLPSAPKR